MVFLGEVPKTQQHKIKMHPNLKFARAWLLKGPLKVPDLCDILTEYAKNFLPDFRHGSKFLILGSKRQGRIALLKDLLHRRKHRYKYGEAVTHVKNHQLCLSTVYPTVGTLPEFLLRQEKSVWLGHELLQYETESQALRNLVMNALNFGVDFFLSAQSVVQVDSFVLRNMDVIFVFEPSTHRHRLKLFHHFFHRAYKDLSMFEEDLIIATQNGGCLCLDQWNFQAYHYMADPTIPHFLI
jgi:hypothetical protein